MFIKESKMESVNQAVMRLNRQRHNDQNTCPLWLLVYCHIFLHFE